MLYGETAGRNFCDFSCLRNDAFSWTSGRPKDGFLKSSLFVSNKVRVYTGTPLIPLLLSWVGKRTATSGTWNLRQLTYEIWSILCLSLQGHCRFPSNSLTECDRRGKRKENGQSLAHPEGSPSLGLSCWPKPRRHRSKVAEGPRSQCRRKKAGDRLGPGT